MPVLFRFGMAMASKWLGATYGEDLFDFDVYALAGDGDLQEGLSHEAASLAGHLKLDNLCWIFDNNHISRTSSPKVTMNNNHPSNRCRWRPIRHRLERARARRHWRLKRAGRRWPEIWEPYH